MAVLIVCTPSNAQDIVYDDDGKIYHPLPTLSTQELDERVLISQNVERQRLGIAPLRWNAQLARDANVWAQYLARYDRTDLPHDQRSRNNEGENLWTGTIHDYTPEEMVGSWIDERKDYRPGVFPYVSRTGDWEDVGHYTQIIWEDTREVGCALAHNSLDEFLVCRYAKPGNWDGQTAIHSRLR
ncbi:MAG: SCP-like extracellular [Alphaproteobacteria bacterium]|nr:SCP-like extracellular [Alphaproteobacteria bacterium]